MNKITFPRIGADGLEYTEDDIKVWYEEHFIHAISNKLNQTFKKPQKEKRRLIRYIKNYLKKILLAPPEKLESYAGIVDRHCKDLIIHNGKRTAFAKQLYKAFQYEKFRQKDLVELSKMLNVKSCPYCNMSFTLYVTDSSSNSFAKFQFDHFYDKYDYPMLSMSLFNLIPSCAVCNHKKSKSRLSLEFHPYYSNISEQFHFEIEHPLSLLAGGKVSDLVDVDLVPDGKTKVLDLEKYNNMFHIKALYQRHGDIAQEVFDKAYEEPYYSNPANFSFLNNRDQSYLKRLWLGTYPETENIHKRPMTKFIQDLWKQAECLRSKDLEDWY